MGSGSAVALVGRCDPARLPLNLPSSPNQRSSTTERTGKTERLHPKIRTQAFWAAKTKLPLTLEANEKGRSKDWPFFFLLPTARLQPLFRDEPCRQRFQRRLARSHHSGISLSIPSSISSRAISRTPQIERNAFSGWRPRTAPVLSAS